MRKVSKVVFCIMQKNDWRWEIFFLLVIKLLNEFIRWRHCEYWFRPLVDFTCPHNKWWWYLISPNLDKLSRESFQLLSNPGSQNPLGESFLQPVSWHFSFDWKSTQYAKIYQHSAMLLRQKLDLFLVPEGLFLAWLSWRKSRAQLQHLLAKGRCWHWSFEFQEGSSRLSALPRTGRVCHIHHAPLSLWVLVPCVPPLCCTACHASPRLKTWRPSSTSFLHWPPSWCRSFRCHVRRRSSSLLLKDGSLHSRSSSHPIHLLTWKSQRFGQDPSIPGI